MKFLTILELNSPASKGGELALFAVEKSLKLNT